MCYRSYNTNGSIVVLLYNFCDIMSLDLTLRKLKLYGVIVARLNGIILLTKVPFEVKIQSPLFFLGFGTSQYMLFQRQD